jgi:hypothetical protein
MKKTLPRVTQILKDNNVLPDWSMVNAETMEAKQLLGTNVHALCARVASGKMGCTDSPADDYARQFVKWLENTNAVVIQSEFTIKATVSGLNYIGHADLEFLWNGGPWLADIKTGVFHKSQELQLAGYAAGGFRLHRRAILKLTPTSAKLIPLTKTKEADWAWAACCTLWRWRNSK